MRSSLAGATNHAMMRPINFLMSRLFRRDKPLRRWTDDEITTERDYLNSLVGTPESETMENQLRAAEYIVQRYYPRDRPLKASAYKRWRLITKDKIASAIAGGPPQASGTDPEFLAWMDAELRLPR